MIPWKRLSLVHISLTRGTNVSLSSIYIPKYLIHETLCIIEPLEYISGTKFFGLGEISMIFVLEILATSLFPANHLDSSTSTEFILAAQTARSGSDKYKTASSVKRILETLFRESISFMNRLKSSGPGLIPEGHQIYN